MSNRDRKDLPHPHDEHLVRAPETHTDRIERKKKESDALDLALEETFPTSDPISPFVPAVPVELHDADDQGVSTRCAHAGCTCAVTPPDVWCSGDCRDAQQGYASMYGSACPCNHPGCAQ